ncbi:MAG TPA: GlsB/YeaQ/YmgE family stress response membrane protein [Labilithrix sp.]|nr:GlsB/YeaQ/YmgE family stress response membrane protein [Labilithrix sp.]
MISIITFILLGLVAGLIARAIMPGRQSMGLVPTALIGMVGSFIGGLFASLLTREPLMRLHSSGIIGSVIGALVVLFVVAYVGKRRTRAIV